MTFLEEALSNHAKVSFRLVDYQRPAPGGPRPAGIAPTPGRNMTSSS